MPLSQKFRAASLPQVFGGQIDFLACGASGSGIGLPLLQHAFLCGSRRKPPPCALPLRNDLAQRDFFFSLEVGSVAIFSPPKFPRSSAARSRLALGLPRRRSRGPLPACSGRLPQPSNVASVPTRICFHSFKWYPQCAPLGLAEEVQIDFLLPWWRLGRVVVCVASGEVRRSLCTTLHFSPLFQKSRSCALSRLRCGG